MTAVDTAPPAVAPPRHASPWLVVGAVLGAAMVVAGAVSFTGLLARHTDTVGVSVAAAPKLVVTVASGDVTVTAGTGDRITGTADRTWSFTRPRLVATRDGDTATLDADCGWVVTGYCDATFRLQVPAGTSVELRSGSGNVGASGVHAPVTLATSSGRATAVDVTDDLTASSSSGDVTVTGVTGDLDLRTSSGAITVRDCAATRVTARDSSGDVSLDLSDDPDAVDARTSSGRVDVRLPDTPGVAYLLHLGSDSGTTSGQVRTDPGSPRTISASTSSGDVSVAYR